jgi:hypothetical protein
MSIPTEVEICVCGHRILRSLVGSPRDWFHVSVGQRLDPNIEKHYPRPRVRDSNGVAS